MPSLSLKIVLEEGAVTRKVKFDSKMSVRDAHALVKDKVIVADPTKEHALFLRSADNVLPGIWLENHRTLDYYMLRDGDSLDYICRIRNLRIKLLDGTVKTLQVDEAKTVYELLEEICRRFLIMNYDEYGLCPEEESKPDEKKAKQQQADRDVTLETLSKTLHTDDNVVWLDQHRSLREQGVAAQSTLILKRRLFYSDRKVDERDPVQLNLLYVQIRDAVLCGHHLVTEDQAAEFAGIQCQIQFGDYQEDKHKPGFIENLAEFLPSTYMSSWGIEKKLFKAHRKHQGLSPLEAKNTYIKIARELPTYGVTFFLVKEKQKGKMKLVPRLLGINSEAILRLDENTKEVLQQWPLTHVKTYHVGKSDTFTLKFGDWSDKEYSCKTQDVLRIRDILVGYIDLIQRRMLAKPQADSADSMAIYHDNVQFGQSNIISHGSNQATKPVTETFVGPTVLVPFQQGTSGQQGTHLTTMHQLIQTNQMNNPQNAKVGEAGVRSGDMSQDCVRKLKRMNSNSVKIVTLLTEPSEQNVQDAQKIVHNMTEDMVVVEMGVKETARQQTVEESKKMLLDEMQELGRYMSQLAGSTTPGHVDTSEAKDAAEKIASLTTEMFFAQDPKTISRGAILTRSKKSFLDGEKVDASIRRASFIAAATSTLAGIDHATHHVAQEYSGPAVDEAYAQQLEKSLQDKIGRLNAALALYLTAHSDPNNVDYPSAINCMNTIHDIMKTLPTDAQKLASTKDPKTRKELLDDMKSLLEGARKLCSLTEADERDKMQEACNKYSNVADKLLFTLARGKNVQREDEIMDLSREVVTRASLLLVSTKALEEDPTLEASSTAALDAAGVRTAAAASDLLICAQLTGPAIQEAHCQSAMSAVCEGLGSSLHQLSSVWQPLVADQARAQLGTELHQREMDVHKALEKLRDAYTNINEPSLEEDALQQKEKRRFRFVVGLEGAKKGLEGVQYTWDKADSTAAEPAQLEAARARLAQQMAQLNAAVAALALATQDPNEPDYATAELALNTISELTPQIVKDTKTVSWSQDEGTRAAMQQQVAALCEANKEILANVENLDDIGNSAAKFSAASSKLVFLISPEADKGKERMIAKVAAEIYDNAAELASNVHPLKQRVNSEAAADLETKGTRLDASARGLLTVAQVTAPSIEEARCASTLSSAVDALRGSSGELTAACHAHMKPGSKEHQQVQDCYQNLHKNLDYLAQLAQLDQINNVDDGTPAAQQTRKRLQFINTMADAKKRLDAADQQLNRPPACAMMREEDAERLQHQLTDKMARLNAAIAELARATHDGENPDYARAQRAADTIAELMPQIVQETCVVSGTKDGATQGRMLQQVQQLCDASRSICDNAGQPQGLNEAAAKFGDASRNLVFCLSPKCDQGKEEKITDLSMAACARAADLQNRVQKLAKTLPREQGSGLEAKAAATAAASQALLTTTKVTAPTITSPQCSAALVSAAEHLRSTAQDLTAACKPHITPGQQDDKQMQTSQQELEKSLDKLVEACQQTPGDQSASSQEQQEKRRLQFINSLSAAKGCFHKVQEQLKDPVICALMKESDGVVLQNQLSDRLAKLNAAVAALAVATADRDHPDYSSAQRAVNTINAVMPPLVQDAQVLAGTKDGDGQGRMLQQVQQLCDVTKAVCEDAAQPQGVRDAVTEFSKASNKLMFTISPQSVTRNKQQIIDLSATSCVRATDLLSQVQALTTQVDGELATDLDLKGASTADAAQNLLAVAQVASLSMNSPECRTALESAVETLRGSAAELTAACIPHTQPNARQDLSNSQKQLNDSLDKLLQICRESKTDGLSNEEREKQRLQFTNSLLGVRSCFSDAQQQLKQPVVCTGKEADTAVLQQQLSERLAQLNAALAALAVATADRDHPDYARAQRAVNTINILTPLLVQESRVLAGTKNGEEQARLLQQVHQLCDAGREVCETAGQPQGLREASAKFSNTSSQLMATFDPEEDRKKQQIVELSAQSYGRASQLLSQTQALTKQVGAELAAGLDRRGAATADAAHNLLTVAQMTGPSISSPQCREALESAVDSLRGSASTLTAACNPHTQPATREQMNNTRQQLNDSLDMILQACKEAADTAPAVLSPEQRERKRLQFIKSLSGAKGCFDDAHTQLQQPAARQLLRQEDESVLQNQLSDRLAQLNAAIAALAHATRDRDQPDYVSAQRAINTISALTPLLVQDAKALSSTKDGDAQKTVLRQTQDLCDASRAICDNAGDPQSLRNVAAKFGDASSKLMFTISPAVDNEKEKQIVDLSVASCGRATELLSQVQTLTQQLDGDLATNLDALGAKSAENAQALLTVAQVTAASIASPHCKAELEKAVKTLRESAAELSAACRPHVKPGAQQKQLQDSHKQLEDSLDLLLQACRSTPMDVGSGVIIQTPQETQRVKFIRSISAVSSNLDDAEKHLKEPIVCPLVRKEESLALQHQLTRRLAQLNAAVAALTSATTDHQKPDYPTAERSIITITELMPTVVQEAKTMSYNKDDNSKIQVQQNVKELYEASRRILENAGDPKKLNEAAIKFAVTSGQLVSLVGDEDQSTTSLTSVKEKGGRPAVPVRATKTVAHPVPSRNSGTTADFLEALRAEESRDHGVRVVGVAQKGFKSVDEDKRAYDELVAAVDSANNQLTYSEGALQLLNSKHVPTSNINPMEVIRKEQHMEDMLAKAGMEVAALVSANYANKLDYKAAKDAIAAMTAAVTSATEDGSAISGTLQEEDQKKFLSDMLALCEASKSVCEASRDDTKKLNNAAILFGNQSAKLLRVVSADVNPALEREVISRAKAIGDSASSLSLEARALASSAGNPASPTGWTPSQAQRIETDGARCVDAAGKLVYTAKLIAPTIHHSTCQDTLQSSADTLSANLATFSETWKPLAANRDTKRLTEESKNLESLLQKLKTDLKNGKLGKRRELDRMVVIDTPLRQLTRQIIDNAKSISEHGELPAEDKQEYQKYSGKLAEALRALDLANARFQRAPHDQKRRYEMSAAVADLEVLVLQDRPARVGQQENNVVDFRDFLEDLVRESDHVTKAVDKYQGSTGKRVADDIRVLCTKINEDVPRLTDPTYRTDDFSDDFTDIDKFAQECDLLVKELNTKIRGVPDHKARAALLAKLLPLSENLHLLRFATNSAKATSQSAAYDAALDDLDHVHSTVMKALLKRDQNNNKKEQTTAYRTQVSQAAHARFLRALRSGPHALGRDLASYCMLASGPAATHPGDTTSSVLEDLTELTVKTKNLTAAKSGQVANGILSDEDHHSSSVVKSFKRTVQLAKPLVNEHVTDELLAGQRRKVQGTRSQLEGQFNQLATKLNSQAGNIFVTLGKPDSAAQNLQAMADTAIQLANTTYGLKDDLKPVQCKKVEDAAHEVCIATFSLIKTSEILSQDPNHHDTRRRLKLALQNLNDAINKLDRAVHPEMKVSRDCSEHLRSLQMHESVLQSPSQPLSASPYTHCLDDLQSQRDVLLKLNSDQAMSRAEFLQSMMFVSTAVGNSADCAAQAAYLLSVSEKDKSIPVEGLVDVPKMHHNIEAIHDSCVTIIMSPAEQATEEKKVLEKLVAELLKDVDDTIEKTNDRDLKSRLAQSKLDMTKSAKALYSAIHEHKPEDVIMDLTLTLDEEVRYLGGVLYHPTLVPIAGQVSADTQSHCDDVVKHSRDLVLNTKELIKEVKLSPEQEMMKWSSYSKRREVLAAFDALLKSIKTNGQKASILEATEDEQEHKSYVQMQTDTAFKWLHKPMAKSDTKACGQQAVRNLVEVGRKMSADLSGAEKEDLHHLVEETEQLLTQCCKRYDQEQYSILMERIRELKKAIERVAVTRVVEDFMDTEDPLADLDILADAERDEKSRKFLLERKIAELLAQLAGVSRAARFIADTGTGGPAISSKLKTCSEQTELLAPKLVKAAEDRISRPDDKIAIENYKALLAQYTESLSKVRELCDQAVDPMEFVQAASDTMQRMREESSQHNDPMRGAITSAAITKLANRVIHVGLSSSTARSDPELQQALTAAQQQLSAATPSPGLRASKMPDWKDTTAQMLRATEEVEQVLGGETIFKKQPVDNQPIYNEALHLHEVTRGWSSRDNEIVAVAKRMAVLMAKLSSFMNTNKQHEVLTTSKAIVAESHEVARLAKKLAHECSDHRIKTNLLQLCERIPTISGQLKMLTTVKASSLGRQDSREDHEAMDMLVNNAQSLMTSTRDVVNAANSASVKIMSQRGPRMKWVRKTYY